MVKFRAEDKFGAMKEWDVTYEEFEHIINTGQPDPDLEVCSDNLTQGQWKPLRELTLYKKAMAARDGGGSLAMRDLVARTRMTEPPPDSKGGTMWTCDKCGKDNHDHMTECLWCNAPRAQGGAPRRANAAVAVQTSDSVSGRYHALRTIAGVFRVLAWVTAVVCVIGVIMSIAAAGKMANSGYGGGAGGLGVIGVLGYLIAGAVGFVSFYATAEGILVFLDIEENTRATRSLAQRTLQAISQLAARPADRGAVISG